MLIVRFLLATFLLCSCAAVEGGSDKELSKMPSERGSITVKGDVSEREFDAVMTKLASLHDCLSDALSSDCGVLGLTDVMFSRSEAATIISPMNVASIKDVYIAGELHVEVLLRVDGSPGHWLALLFGNKDATLMPPHLIEVMPN